MFRDAKVGDRVWSMPFGWGTIIEISPYAEDQTIEVKWDLDGACGYYGLDGKVYKSDLMPFLFWGEIQITPPTKPKKQKVKKTVEGWAVREGDDDFDFTTNERWKKHWEDCGDVVYKATLTYEIEE